MDNDEALWVLARTAQLKAVQQRRRRMKRQSDAAQPLAPPQAVQHSPMQRRGNRAEEQAREHLEAQGLVVLQQNLRCKAGEIDLVCRDGPLLVFVEVRYRQSNRYGGAAASVNRSKQERLLCAATYFLPRLARRHFRGLVPACRFDVVALDEQSLIWIKDAFGAPAVR